jgi:hypothetical protein
MQLTSAYARGEFLIERQLHRWENCQEEKNILLESSSDISEDYVFGHASVNCMPQDDVIVKARISRYANLILWSIESGV